MDQTTLNNPGPCLPNGRGPGGPTGFLFHEEPHAYTLGRQRLESVSDVLLDNGLVDPQYFTRLSRERGRAVHAGIHYALLGRLDWATLHPELHGWVRSGLRLIETLKVRVLEMETPHFHPTWLYAGTLDVLFEHQGGEVIADYKSGAMPPTTKFSLWAYDHLQPVRQPRRHWGIKLHEDGRLATLVEFDADRYAFEKFLAFLTTTRERVAAGVSALDMSLPTSMTEQKELTP